MHLRLESCKKKKGRIDEARKVFGSVNDAQSFFSPCWFLFVIYTLLFSIIECFLCDGCIKVEKTFLLYISTVFFSVQHLIYSHSLYCFFIASSKLNELSLSLSTM